MNEEKLACHFLLVEGFILGNIYLSFCNVIILASDSAVNMTFSYVTKILLLLLPKATGHIAAV